MTEKELIKQLKQSELLIFNGQVNYRNYNIEHPIRDIKSTDRQKFRNAIYILCEMIKVGRKPALHILFIAFEENKNDFKRLELIAEKLEKIDNDEYIDFIFDFLEKTKSNATSRIFIRSLVVFYTMLETEKDNSEYVFNFLKQSNIEVYHNPNKTEIEKYVSNANNCIVVKDLITEAPIQNIENRTTISLEKMLVDVFCVPDLYAPQQDAELENIFKNAFEKYTINRDKLLRYSARRKRKQKLIEFLKYLNI